MGELLDRIDNGREGDPAPQRKYRLVLDLGADSRSELLWALDEISERIRHDHTAIRSQTTGSPGAGWHWELNVDEAQTHDGYIEAIDRDGHVIEVPDAG